MKLCSIDGCGRRHAAHGWCLMHYKRVQKHGSPEYRWGGKVVGRACRHCARPVAARDFCLRHYQMWHRHGDPLFADKKKLGGMPVGTSLKQAPTSRRRRRQHPRRSQDARAHTMLRWLHLKGSAGMGRVAVNGSTAVSPGRNAAKSFTTSMATGSTTTPLTSMCSRPL
jgi:hypothetical protein